MAQRWKKADSLAPTAQLKAYKAFKPVTSQVVEQEKETRIDLPFCLIFDNLTYIGVVMRETWNVPPHYHDHFELCYVDEGQGWFAIDEISYTVQQGDLFLTKPGEVHCGAAAGDLPFRLYYIGFQLNQMNALEIDYYQLGVHRVVADQENLIKGIFDGIFTELWNKQKHCLEMVQGLFLRLLVHVLRAYEHTATVQNEAPLALSPALREALYLIHTEIGNCLSIDELAGRVHLSRSHLTREFKRHMGVSLGQYMRVLCLEWAKYYLRETSDTVSAIAVRLSFPSIHTFSIFFKRHTGLSPQEYRKQALQQLP